MIDTKRLATDAEYWDSVAPEGATRYDERYLYPWRRSEEGCELYFSPALQNWVSTSRRKDSEGIPRPKAPEAEWVDGPDDGELCVVWDDECNKGVYFLCEFQADGPRFQEHPKGGCFYPDEISGHTKTGIVIRTKEQRQRDELARVLGETTHMRKTFGEMADAIIAAGWRKGP